MPHLTILYTPQLAAETDMGPGTGIEERQDAAFTRLAAFIFAENRAGPEGISGKIPVGA